MNIRINNVKIGNLTIPYPIPTRGSKIVSVIEAKLVFIETLNPLFYRYVGKPKTLRNTIVLNNGSTPLNKNYWIGLSPFLISETEKIEIGDFIYTPTKTIVQVINENGIGFLERHPHNCYKVLALPEHFNKLDVQRIVKKNVTENEIVLLECDKKYDYLLVSSGDKPYYEIKFNTSNEIIFHKKEEQEKKYSEIEVKEMLRNFATYIDQDKVESPSIYRKLSDQWFEQNKNSNQRS